jgi:rhamnogalacturonan endolyase
MKKQLLFEFTKYLSQKITFRLAAFTVFTLLTVQSTFAQKWNVIGSGNDISTVVSSCTSIAVAGDVPYVAYVEAAVGAWGVGKVKTKNATSGLWEQLGGDLASQASFTRIFKDKTGKLYVTYVDKSASPSQKLAVKTFDGTAWVPLISGNEFVSTGAASATLAVSDIRSYLAFDSNNVPYIAYSERVGTTTGAFVKRFINGIWETLGGGAVSSDLFAGGNGIALDSNDVPYVVYVQQSSATASTGVIKTFRYNGTSWVDFSPPTPVGTAATNSVRHTAITIDSANTPVVCYFNAANSSVCTVIRYNGTLWSFIGVNSTKAAKGLAMVNDTAGNLYNVFTDDMTPTQPTLRVYKQSSSGTAFTELQNIPTTTLSTFGIDDNSSNTAIAVGTDTSKPYIVYTKLNGSVLTPVVRVFAPADPTNVKITENGTTVVMENGIVKATITKATATVTSLVYNGLEMIQGGYGGGSIYWSWNMPNYQNPSSCTYSLITDPSANSFNSAEIKLHMTWDGTASTAAMDVDVYYSLQRNVSGLYAAATLSHPAAYPDLQGGEWRMASYPNPRLDWLSVDALRNRKMPTAADLASSVAVPGAPLEVTRLTTGIYKDQYECKYDYSADFGDIDTWGWSSTVDNVGLWVTASSKEYYGGGPKKTELFCHANPVMLNMLGGTHFGGGQETAVAAGEEWRKDFGPFLIYCNKVASGTTNANLALWEDAKTKAKTEQNAWPYQWHANPAYIKQAGRGTVTGKLVINDSGNPTASVANTWVGLGIPPTGTANTTQFQRWSKNYQFWVKTDANGNFTIPDVIPGTYSLFAFGSGANGQLSLSNAATVTAGSTTALGNVSWVPTRVAKTVWEIGTPDRDTKEFRHGSDWWTSNTYPDTRWGIFMNYPQDFPTDVNFTIGQSNIATDWNYVHYWDKNLRAASPAWNVNFNLAQAPTTGTTASVYVGIAEIKSAALILSVNGTNVTTPSTGISFVENSNAMLRKSTHGTFNETRFDFPGSLLKIGTNQITFTIRVGGSETLGDIMYDYIRLEADLGSTLSIDSFEKSDLAKAFPNPTHNNVTVTIPETAVLEKILVYNSLGQLVSTESENTVSLEKLNSGNYYFLIITSTGNYVKKIIKL